MTDKILKVFIVEDLKTDLELTKRQVLKYNPKSTFTVATNKQSFLEKIEWFLPDVIISDYSLPDTNGVEILLHVKQKLPNVPFIFVTGTLNNEEKVAYAVLQGANGFVLKHNMNNLPAELKRVMDENDARIEAAKIQAEKERQHQILLGKLEAKIIELGNGPKKQEALKIVKKLQIVK